MGVVDQNANIIANRDAKPRVPNNAFLAGGMPRAFASTIEIASGDSVNSIYRMATIPSNARLHELKVYSDDIGTTTAADIGLYDTTENGSAVVDADLFASALSLNAGALSGSDILVESGVFGPESLEKRIWEALGLSADPQKFYDICATLTGAADAAGTFTLLGLFVV